MEDNHQRDLNLYDKLLTTASESAVSSMIYTCFFAGLLITVLLVLGGCSSTNPETEGQPSITDGPDPFLDRAQRNRTRNSTPQGGNYEKSDRTPPSLDRRCD